MVAAKFAPNKLQWVVILLGIVSPVAVLGFLLSLEARLTSLETKLDFITRSVSVGILPHADRRLSVLEERVRRLEDFVPR